MAETVLYRCGAPTNLVCACGSVGKALNRAGVEYETRRVPAARKGRPEIVELTGQDRVPVLVDGDQVIHDSRRIREYIELKWGDRQR
ncbi:MAG: glutathione S-transferase N-terminal domain-containing protein [Solirubrobacterales bacterium]|nr:glutathione S-transferase N-terminal domain-containing protein [Solirubrobacterales bacterium]